jgi:hypothetical protein
VTGIKPEMASATVVKLDAAQTATIVTLASAETATVVSLDSAIKITLLTSTYTSRYLTLEAQ